MIYDNLQIETTKAAAFCHSGQFNQGMFDWHVHRWPHLLYAVSGTMQVEVEDALWLLPPQRAAWIAAEVPHRTVCFVPTQFQAIFIDPQQFEAMLPTRVFAVTPLAREMIRYALRWGVERDPADEMANQFFRTLVMLCRQWMADELALRLPRPQSEPLQRVVNYVLGELDVADLAAAAALIAVSPRTLRRQMQREMQITWRQFLHDARMMRAMELLASGEHTVLEVALVVGYNSLSAFTKAFTIFTGENPSRYLARCVSPSSPVSNFNELPGN